jgi:hypothetical protein
VHSDGVFGLPASLMDDFVCTCHMETTYQQNDDDLVEFQRTLHIPLDSSVCDESQSSPTNDHACPFPRPSPTVHSLGGNNSKIYNTTNHGEILLPRRRNLCMKSVLVRTVCGTGPQSPVTNPSFIWRVSTRT